MRQDWVGQRVESVDDLLVFRFRTNPERFVQKFSTVGRQTSKGDANVVKVERRDAALRRQFDTAVWKDPEWILTSF